MKTILNNVIENNIHLIKQGKLADYIPALNNPDKLEHLGVTLIDEYNKIYSIGDYAQKFTIQSISKVIALILAISDNGVDKVFENVGFQAVDEPFNNFIKLDLSVLNRPANPMINSGAIVITSMIKGEKEEKFNRLLKLTKLITNNKTLDYNKEVYISEKNTGDRNRSIAYLMKSKGLIKGEVTDILDTYFKQCSIEVDTIDLANIGRFISGGCKGIHLDSITNEKLTALIKGILFNCGMYNYSTEYSIKVGIPSKSGVGGGIMGVLPNNMGIGIYSPPLDAYGNSVAGIGIITELSEKQGWNMLHRY